MTSKPTGPDAQPENGVIVGGGDSSPPEGPSAPEVPEATSALGEEVPPPSDAVDHTDRQNLMDTQTAAPRRPGEPAGDEDVSGPDAGWFQSTQPPTDTRSDRPEGEAARIDPVMYVLGAIAVVVVLLVLGSLLMR